MNIYNIDYMWSSCLILIGCHRIPTSSSHNNSLTATSPSHLRLNIHTTCFVLKGGYRPKYQDLYYGVNLLYMYMVQIAYEFFQIFSNVKETKR